MFPNPELGLSMATLPKSCTYTVLSWKLICNIYKSLVIVPNVPICTSNGNVFRPCIKRWKIRKHVLEVDLVTVKLTPPSFLIVEGDMLGLVPRLFWIWTPWGHPNVEICIASEVGNPSGEG